MTRPTPADTIRARAVRDRRPPQTQTGDQPVTGVPWPDPPPVGGPTRPRTTTEPTSEDS